MSYVYFNLCLNRYYLIYQSHLYCYIFIVILLHIFCSFHCDSFFDSWVIKKYNFLIFHDELLCFPAKLYFGQGILNNFNSLEIVESQFFYLFVFGKYSCVFENIPHVLYLLNGFFTISLGRLLILEVNLCISLLNFKCGLWTNNISIIWVLVQTESLRLQTY